LISNNGKVPISIGKGDRIAQLLIIKDPPIKMEIVESIDETERAEQGFGSTGVRDVLKNKSNVPPHPAVIPISIHNQQSTTAAAATLDGTQHEPICNIDISHNPFNDIQKVEMEIRGNHDTRGLILENCDQRQSTVIIKTCKPGTPATKIRNWRKRLKNSHLISIDGVAVENVTQAQHILQQAPLHTTVTLEIGLSEKLPMHDDHSIPMMYFDQLNTVATHLEHIKTNNGALSINPSENKKATTPIRKAIQILQTAKSNTISKLTGILPKSKIKSKKLTRKKVQASKEWETWKLAEWQQLDQYFGQKMFGEPCKLPPGANILSLIWCYDVKSDG
jgi:hypothetical protein